MPVAPIHRLLVTALMGVLLTLAGCSGVRTDDAPADARGDDAWQPVTIEHALGTAVIDHEPKRIVTLGQGSAETAIALGNVPVGIEEYPWGSDDTGYLPWIHEAVTERGATLPTQFTGGTELDIEAIVELQPDLILASWSGITREQYDVLKDVAPTVAYEKEPWVSTWTQQIAVIGQALGKSDEANQLITKTQGQLRDASRKEYEGLTFSYIYNTGPGTLGVFFPSEQRVAMVSALGLTVDPVVETLRKYEVAGTDSAEIGLENAERLRDSDLIFTFYMDDASRKEIEAQPLYRQIPAVARGSVVAPADQSLVTASSIINPLTVPWVLDRFIPKIDEAVAHLPR